VQSAPFYVFVETAVEPFKWISTCLIAVAAKVLELQLKVILESQKM